MKKIIAKIVFYSIEFVLIAVGGYCAIRTGRDYAVDQYHSGMAWVAQYFTRVEVVKEYVNPHEVELGTLIRDISKDMGVNPVITFAIVEKESNFNSNAIRFEDDMTPKNADAQTRMKYASHGLMQIMAFNSKRCGLEWSELYDRSKNIRCGLKILKDNLKESQAKTPAGRLRLALRKYNGRGEKAENYADAVMANIADALLQNLGDGV